MIMSRFIVVIFMLWSVFGIDAERQREPQVHNVTHLEKRSPMIEEKKKKKKKSICDTASYRKVSLNDFVYRHLCFPVGWKDFLDEKEVQKQIKYISDKLLKFVKDENYFIEPPMHNIFKAFTVPRDGVKVVILGQDPTPKPGKATGMAFSLEQGVHPRKVPSVLNMLVELKREGFNVGLSNGDLSSWRDQGVLLLNAALTVQQKGQARSHQGLWETFTELLLQHISNKGPRSAWILWGDKAKAFADDINSNNYIKTGSHPAPQSAAGFFFGNYFICANEFLKKSGIDEIAWDIPPSANEIARLGDLEKC